MHERYTVKTRVTPHTKSEIDYATYPTRELNTLKHKGITHETICNALERGRELVYQPRRSTKAWRDVRRLTSYKEYKAKEKKKKVKK